MNKRFRVSSGIPIHTYAECRTSADYSFARAEELMRAPMATSRVAFLPEKLFTIADIMMDDGDTIDAAWIAQHALGLTLTLVEHLPLELVVPLDLKRDFQRDANERLISFRITGYEPAAGRDIPVIFGRTLARQMASYVETFRPLRLGKPSTALFPDPAGGHISADSFVDGLTNLIVAELTQYPF